MLTVQTNHVTAENQYEYNIAITYKFIMGSGIAPWEGFVHARTIDSQTSRFSDAATSTKKKDMINYIN